MAKKKKKKKQSSLYTILIIIGIVICFVVAMLNTQNSDENTDNETKAASEVSEQLQVNFLDVGQGDCEFIILPDGKSVLIDSGERDMSDKVIGEVGRFGDRIDYLIITHPHTDHMGCMSDVIDAFDIGEIYMPKVAANTKAYEKLLRTIKSKGLKINIAKAHKTVYENDNIKLEFLSPIRDGYDDLNNYSAVVKLTYGKSSFLFTGDAEKLVEDDMLKEFGYELDVDVLKVGHHGSRYSSSKKFLEAVSPEYAIIECGEDNSYGHPHSQALDRLMNVNAEIYRTDLAGDICIMTSGDGKYEVGVAAQPAPIL